MNRRNDTLDPSCVSSNHCGGCRRLLMTKEIAGIYGRIESGANVYALCKRCRAKIEIAMVKLHATEGGRVVGSN